MKNEKLCICNYDNLVANKLEKISGQVRPEDCDLILKMKKDLETEGISKGRVFKYLCVLSSISNKLRVPFQDATIDDLKDYIRWLENDAGFEEWTKHDYKAILKKFYKWLEKSDVAPERVRWIKTRIKNHKRKLPEQLLTREEVRRLIDAANNVRDKAFIECLYFSGGRVGEVLTRRIKHFQPAKPYDKLLLEGKTGSRVIELTSSVYMKAWLNCHPSADPNSPIWVSLQVPRENEMLSYSKVAFLIKALGKRAGINKELHPHLFRHSRMTELAKHMTEHQLCQFAGWVMGSFMTATYVHMSQRDLQASLLRSEGQKVDDNSEVIEKIEISKCMKCGSENPAGFRFCTKCGMVIDDKMLSELDVRRTAMEELFDKLLRDEVVGKRIEDIFRSIRERGRSQ